MVTGTVYSAQTVFVFFFLVVYCKVDPAESEKQGDNPERKSTVSGPYSTQQHTLL